MHTPLILEPGDGERVTRSHSMAHPHRWNASPEPRKKPSYFPWNPGCLIGIFIVVYEIIPI